MDVTLAPIEDWAVLAARWRSLPAPSPFLSWHFVGARAALRFDAPWILAVQADGTDVALALLNHAGGRFFLNTTGDAGRDAVFIEHNGMVGRAAAVGVALRAVLERAPVVVAGVDDAFLRAAEAVGIVTRHQARFAPCVDLAAVRGAFLDTLSANARGQIRRAMRLCGEVAIARAADAATAHAWFAEMVELHQASWRARGKPGAFADADTVAFHGAVIESSFAGDPGQAGRTADMLRVRAAGRTLGVLYMLRHGGHACCYQSGFVAVADARAKPGLVCHVAAIEFYRSEGLARYDLLAGAARYKATLAGTGGQMLHWFTLHPRGALGARVRRLAEMVAGRVRLKERLR